MFEVFSVIAGVIICGIAFLALMILGDYTDRFGRWLGILGFGCSVVSVAYFSSFANEYLFFGFAGLYMAIMLALIFASIVYGIKKYQN